MRMIERSTLFKKDFKRIKANPTYSKKIDNLLSSILEFLVNDRSLPDKNRDHELYGNWKG